MQVLLIYLVLQSLTFGEYRVFELEANNPETGKSRQIQSVLDQYQYPQYYPLQPGESLKYIKSWKCWGRSDYEQPLCPGPEDTALKQKTN